MKEKCQIAGTDLDSTIDNLITEQLPVIEFLIRESALEDTGNAGLQDTLSLGATEIVCGELLAQLLREAGAADTMEFGTLVVRPHLGRCPSDPFALRALGMRRLRPFLKLDPRVPVAVEVWTGTDRSGTEEEL